MRRILTDLDTLLDTRLGVLEQINPDAACKVVEKDQYWSRIYTDWSQLTDGLVDNETFQDAWEARDTNVLHKSVVTGIPLVMCQVLSDYLGIQEDGLVEEDVELVVNVAPYDLNATEIEDLEEILRELLYSNLAITFRSIPLDEITPTLLNDEYALVVMFEMHRWIRVHCFGIIKQPCKGLNMIMPKLMEKNPGDLNNDQVYDEFTGFRLSLLPYFDIEFVDARWFSLINPGTLEQTA